MSQRDAYFGSDLLGVGKWEEFREGINILYDGFADYLEENYVALLTINDFKLCCLACAGFSTKEIASFMRITESTVNNRRYTISEKVSTSEQKVKFMEFIHYLKEESKKSKQSR